MPVLIGAGRGEDLQLLQEQRVLEDPLNGLDEVRLQGGRVLLAGIPGCQELLQGLVAFA